MVLDERDKVVRQARLGVIQGGVRQADAGRRETVQTNVILMVQRRGTLG